MHLPIPPVHASEPISVPGIVFRVPLSAPTRKKINYKGKGKTYIVRKEKAKDPRTQPGGGGVDYRFYTFFQ